MRPGAVRAEGEEEEEEHFPTGAAVYHVKAGLPLFFVNGAPGPKGLKGQEEPSNHNDCFSLHSSLTALS